jgi:hypothetical protein
MPNRFASGKYAIAQCDRCNFRYKLKELKRLIIKTKNINILVCPECWEPDQPQLLLGMYPVDDPQAVRNPRPDSPSYEQSGIDVNGDPSGGSRVFQWGWAPVGGASYFDTALTPNSLIAVGQVGTVTINIS